MAIAFRIPGALKMPLPELAQWAADHGFGALDIGGPTPEAVEAVRGAGLDVDRSRLAAMLWSGGLCGLAGAVELSGVLGTLYENYAPGYGFTAIAVALLGRLNPYGIVASALFFGALSAGSGSMERTAGISANLSYVLQAVTLLVLLGSQWVRWERRAVNITQEGTAPDSGAAV